jgi:hypothetical protein
VQKEIRLWNGRGPERNTHLYVGAYSAADACRLLKARWPQIGWPGELSIYFSECWGNSMVEIKPARGVWLQMGFGGKPKRLRIKPSQA